MPWDEDDAERHRERRVRERILGTGVWNAFTLDQQDHLLVNLAPVIASATSVALAFWGLVALGSFSLPRAGYGAAALLAGVALYVVTSRFTNGERWTLPVVALTPVVVAGAVYLWLTPSLSQVGPGDALGWALVAGLALSPATLLVGPVHPSWQEGPGESQ